MKLEITKEWLLKTLELEDLLITLQGGTGELAINPEQLIEWEVRAKKFYKKLVVAQTEKYEKLLKEIDDCSQWHEVENILKKYKINRDFEEDYNDENGNYMCRCIHCEQSFLGYKRRLVCKSCEGISKTK